MSPSAIDTLDLRQVRTVYLSGPITGMPDLNVDAFSEAATMLRELAIDVFNPMEHQSDDVALEGPEAYRHYMAIELPEVTRSDAVVVLDGWENSNGARLEVHTAITCGIPILSYPDLAPVDVTGFIVARKVATAGPFAPPTPAMIAEAARVPAPHRITRGIVDDLKDIWDGGQRIVENAVTGGQKETRAARFDLLPWDQLWKVAELYAYGALKYEDRNWERGYAFSLSIAALHRHMAKFVQGEDVDEETGCSHLASVVFHALALMRFVEGTQLDLLPPELDDRPVGKRVRAREDQA